MIFTANFEQAVAASYQLRFTGSGQSNTNVAPNYYFSPLKKQAPSPGDPLPWGLFSSASIPCRSGRQ